MKLHRNVGHPFVVTSHEVLNTKHKVTDIRGYAGYCSVTPGIDVLAVQGLTTASIACAAATAADSLEYRVCPSTPL